ncbi:MAG: PDZ domain-containing protein [Bryobacterales bacterium]|nr:PDZ domain-containing protein [Bryobacterales bacterium]
MFDAQVVLSPKDSPRGKLMSQYVCVRVPRMDNVDIGLFEYDRYNTLYFFILNADEHIYMRYGGRDANSQDSFLSLPSIELALAKGLELHKQYQEGKIARKPRPKPVFPKEFAHLVKRTFATGACVECHLIGDFVNVHREEDGTLDKTRHLYQSPDFRIIGLHFDVPKGLVVKDAQGAVKTAGLQPGDLITALNGETVYTFGDLQFLYDKLPRTTELMKLTMERAGKPVELDVRLPHLWWKTDIRFRQMSIDPRTYFDSQALTAERKKELGLKADGFASEVTRVDAFAQMMKSHELKAGDVIVAVDGVDTDPFADTAEFYIKLRKKAGDSVTLEVLRDGQRIKMPLKTYRMSFRK